MPSDRRPDRIEWSKAVPLKLFGDGVAVLGISRGWGKSVETYLLSPLATPSSPRCSQILLCFLWKKSLTRAAILKWWRTLTWSLNSLSRGMWPETNFNGEPHSRDSEGAERANNFLAGGYKGRIIALTGDLEYIHQGYGLNSSTSTHQCSKCLANGDAIPWTDSKMTSSWRRSVVGGV